MLNVMIVDDETTHIQGLIRHIRWRELGYEPPITAESGEEALAVLEHTPIDVLISDVSMPGMTGIELVARFKAHNPHIQSLMISGYNEFDFVQDAMHAGALAYVLKPLKTEEVEDKLTAFRATLDRNGQMTAQMEALHAKVSDSVELVKERFAADLLEGTTGDSGTVASWRRLLDLPEADHGVRVIILGLELAPGRAHEAETYAASRLEFHLAVRALMNDCADLYVARAGDGRAAAVQLNPAPETASLLENRLCLFRRAAKAQFGISVTICGSRRGSSWFEAHKLYKEAKLAATKVRLSGEENRQQHKDWLDQSNDQDIRLRGKLIPEIVQLTEIGEMTQAADLLNDVFDSIIPQEHDALSEVLSFGIELLIELTRRQQAGGASDGNGQMRLWRQLLACRSANEAKAVIVAHLAVFAPPWQGDRAHRPHQLILKIARFIETNLHESLTVKQIADLHYMNASYLSVLFKKETGQTISDFVQTMRMDKAKELLQDPSIKIYEVAEQIGFQNTAYFTHLFKKLVGCTPKNYRDYYA
ncbi:response regulator [Paenibacillus sp. GCM10027626]|uniref:response regulator transcription factor n=1 Tax=Paenibacillus sp. GCM10027626 TaxID=3273411 RepID=UPI0036336931